MIISLSVARNSLLLIDVFIDPSERNFLICGTSVILVLHSEKSLPQLLMVGVTSLLLVYKPVCCSVHFRMKSFVCIAGLW